MKQYKIGDFISVKWKDAVSYSNWSSLKETQEKVAQDAIIKTSGYVVANEEDYLAIAQNKKGDMCSHVTKIHKNMIVEVKDSPLVVPGRLKIRFRSFNWLEIVLFLIISLQFVVIFFLIQDHERTYVCSSDGRIQEFERLTSSFKSGYINEKRNTCIDGYWVSEDMLVRAGISKTQYKEVLHVLFHEENEENLNIGYSIR